MGQTSGGSARGAWAWELRARVVTLWLLSILSMPFTPSMASNAPPSPLERTRTVLEETRRIVESDREHDAKLDALFSLLKGFLDTDTMARAALARHWDEFSSAQQKEFGSLFRELFQRTYVQKLLLFERPDFEYDGEEITEGTAVVKTRIVTPRDDFAVLYDMRRTDDGWQATDIRIEDLSLTDNFRRQLDALLQKSSVENVLRRMRRKYGTKKEEEARP